MKNLYHFIIDQSGSMSDCHGVTIKAINQQFASIRKLSEEEKGQEFKTTLHFFNERYSTQFFQKAPEELIDLNYLDYSPYGRTALYDAIGCIASKERRYSSYRVKHKLQTVVFIIVTDGYENASVYFNFGELQMLIGEMQEDNYLFLFMGAIYDAKEVAERMRIKKEHAYAFSKSDLGNTFKKMSMSLEDLAKKKADWNHFEK